MKGRAPAVFQKKKEEELQNYYLGLELNSPAEKKAFRDIMVTDGCFLLEAARRIEEHFNAPTATLVIIPVLIPCVSKSIRTKSSSSLEMI